MSSKRHSAVSVAGAVNRHCRRHFFPSNSPLPPDGFSGRCAGSSNRSSAYARPGVSPKAVADTARRHGASSSASSAPQSGSDHIAGPSLSRPEATSSARATRRTRRSVGGPALPVTAMPKPCSIGSAYAYPASVAGGLATPHCSTATLAHAVSRVASSVPSRVKSFLAARRCGACARSQKSTAVTRAPDPSRAAATAASSSATDGPTAPFLFLPWGGWVASAAPSLFVAPLAVATPAMGMMWS
mmetsp:Transcript_30798/g.95131  ORF Transcript_30798/g.95131 Transcript_30798/m.95131 type:complete len:243 (-) Transcript_30798:559-1287(-)